MNGTPSADNYRGRRSAGRYLLRFSSPSTHHLVCFPWAGASAGVFRSWQPFFAGEVTLLGVQLPARGSRIAESLPTDLAFEARQIAEEIEAVGPGTCHLLGHSMGAKLAYLTAVELIRREISVSSLTVMGSCGPGGNGSDFSRDVARMSEGELIAYLREFGGTPEEVLTNQGLLDLLLGVVRADFLMNAMPLPADATVLPVPVLAIGGASDKHVSLRDVEAWRAVSGRAFTCQMIEGGHFFLNSQRDLVLTLVRKHLHEAAGLS
jgi:medium-chain acyl-[acyl-carrier-protein] hydrolase